MRHRSIITAVLVSGALAAVPAASAQDLRSPDARDSARQTSAGFDLRSPDARELAARAAMDRTAEGRVYADSLVVPDAAPAVISEPDRFDVRDAFVGALVALALAVAGVALTGFRRRRVVGATGG